MQPQEGLGLVVKAVLKSGGGEKCTCVAFKPEFR